VRARTRENKLASFPGPARSSLAVRNSCAEQPLCEFCTASDECAGPGNEAKNKLVKYMNNCRLHWKPKGLRLRWQNIAIAPAVISGTRLRKEQRGGMAETEWKIEDVSNAPLG